MQRQLTNLALVAIAILLVGASVVAHAAHGGFTGTVPAAAVHASPTPAAESPGKHKAKKSPKPAKSPHPANPDGDSNND
jgi:hypothetical protein